MYDGYLNRYSFVNNGRKTILVPLSSANVFAHKLKLEERKKEFEEKKVKRKTRVEWKNREKSKRKKEEWKKRWNWRKKEERELFGYNWRGEKAFTKIDLCTYVQRRIFGL